MGHKFFKHESELPTQDLICALLVLYVYVRAPLETSLERTDCG